jgi:predicted lipoprotein with Yx(FWY)xxD motif
MTWGHAGVLRGMKLHLMTPVVGGALALTLAACGSSSNKSASSSSPAKPASSSGQTVSTTQVGGVGKVLVDATGMALYTPTGESATNVRCTGACVSIWKPLSPGSGAPTAAADAGKIGVITRPDGSKQVTVGGKPLYTFAQDSPGAVNGNGASDAFGGKQFTWHVVTSGGAAAPASKPASSSGGGYSNGY